MLLCFQRRFEEDRLSSVRQTFPASFTGFPLMDIDEQTDKLYSDDAEENWSSKDALLALVAFAVIAAIAVSAYFFYQSTEPAPLIEGSVAPGFTLPLLHGGSARLSDYRGQVVLINLWASWCDPCKQEMPSMERLYQSMKGKPFVILAASVDANKSDVVQFVNQLGLTFPILLDPGKNVFNLYQASGQPESFIVDKNGKIAKHIIGPLADWNDQQDPDVQLIYQLVNSR